MRTTLPPIVARTLLCLLCTALHFAGFGQDRPSGTERRTARKLARLENLHDPNRWDRMPFWATGVGVSTGYPSGKAMSADLSEVGVDKNAAVRLEAGRRLKKGWYVMTQVEHDRFRTGAVKDPQYVATWTDNWSSVTQYMGDFITAQHDVNTLTCLTGVHAAPFPRRKKVGFNLSMGVGLAAQVVTADHGVQRDRTYNVESGFLDNLFGGSDEPAVDVLRTWSHRQECGRQTAVGMSVVLDLRMELWLGRHVSLLLPSLNINVPVVAPHFSAVNDEQGEVLEGYDLDLAAVRVGTGLLVHF